MIAQFSACPTEIFQKSASSKFYRYSTKLGTILFSSRSIRRQKKSEIHQALIRIETSRICTGKF